MLGTEYIVVAVVLRLAAGVSYLAMTWRGTARPNPVSWLCWGATPLVAFAAQIQDGVTSASWVTLSLGVGPLLVFAVSVGRNTAWRAGRTDMMCGGCAALGIVLWQVADNPGPALTLSILADILGSIPTLAKVYYEPHSEKASPYLMSLLGMVVTLLTLDGWEYFDYAFPLYMLLINLSIFGLIVTRSVQLRRPAPGPLEPQPSNLVGMPRQPARAGQAHHGTCPSGGCWSPPDRLPSRSPHRRPSQGRLRPAFRQGQRRGGRNRRRHQGRNDRPGPTTMDIYVDMVDTVHGESGTTPVQV
ncbi:conserved membrane hypothetical protein [Frankia sp. Hr75.2]|nr:conserved membrane hypothetical protein [Frankia sp. Hr75.2]